MGNMKNLATVKSTETEGGVKSNLKTIDMMRRIARKESGNPLIRQLAINILNDKKVRSHQYIDEALALAEWVQGAIPYVMDANGIEQLHSPTMIIKKIQSGDIFRGDCDDMSLMLATLLLSIGHRPMFKCVRYKSTSPKDSYNHIYVIEKTKNYPFKPQLLVMDCIHKDKNIGYEVDALSSDVFEI
jgi:hypothetical protein